MTTYRVNGQRIERADWEKLIEGREGLVAPRVSRFEDMESPVTGKTISSWRERDADMKAADAFDPRDLRKDHQYRRGRDVQRAEARKARENG